MGFCRRFLCRDFPGPKKGFPPPGFFFSKKKKKNKLGGRSEPFEGAGNWVGNAETETKAVICFGGTGPGGVFSGGFDSGIHLIFFSNQKKKKKTGGGYTKTHLGGFVAREKKGGFFPGRSTPKKKKFPFFLLGGGMEFSYKWMGFSGAGNYPGPFGGFFNLKM